MADGESETGGRTGGTGRRALLVVLGQVILFSFFGAGAASRPPEGPAAAAKAGPRDGADPGSSRDSRYLSRARFLMGAPLAIEAAGQNAERAIEAAFEEVERLDEVLSNWHDSELVRLNQRAAAGPTPCSEDLFRAVTEALRWAEESEGAFDPTVEPIVRRLGLRGEDGRLPLPDAERLPLVGVGDRPDDPAGTAGDRLPVGWRLVRVDRQARTVAFAAPGMGLDLGGIGKGFALDAALRVLRSHGVTSALLDFGGQLLASGPGPDDGGWLVGLADPRERGRPIGILSLRAASLATSSQGERGRSTGKGWIGHIVDPRSGVPAPFDGSVTVRAPDATSADALDTGLLVMGPERGVHWAGSRGLDVLFLSRDSEGQLVGRGTGSLYEDMAAEQTVRPQSRRSSE